MDKKLYIVIVDAFASGALLAPEFKKLGYTILHIKTAKDFSLRLSNSFIPTDFEYCFNAYDFYNTLDLVKKLSEYEIECVLPGCDAGVILAEKLSYYLGLSKNNLDTLLSKRSKFFMHEMLHKNNLLAAKQIKSSSIEEILTWYDKQSFIYVVVKPEYGASSEGVFFCKNKDDIIFAFNKNVNLKNIFGLINFELVVQEYLFGPEYIVNSISIKGEHYITDIWLGVDDDEEKISADLYAELIQNDNHVYKELSYYVKKVLSCTGVSKGPAHTEVRYTPRGPALIEIGARLAGYVSPKSVFSAIGLNPITLAVNSYVRQNIALDTLKKMRKPKHALFVYFYSTVDGVIQNDPDLSKMYSLASTQEVFFPLNIGDLLYKTDDISGRQGYAYLVNDSKLQLKKDYNQFIQLEKELYHNILISRD
ncbi:MAG: ATP-grasp domain-containing protein [Legionellaceae bacterium]|nr:ATP-grasp domain-containing protein [Legionellaceae bacterium]